MGTSFEQYLVWHEIDGKNADRPEAESEVMVYDQALDDVVLAELRVDEGTELWIESTSGEALPEPIWWAEKPYPDLD